MEWSKEAERNAVWCVLRAVFGSPWWRRATKRLWASYVLVFVLLDGAARIYHHRYYCFLLVVSCHHVGVCGVCVCGSLQQRSEMVYATPRRVVNES